MSAGRGIVDAFVTIGRQGGVSGLWKGVVPNCQRAGLVQLGDLTTYDAAKQRIMGLGKPRRLVSEESLLSPLVDFPGWKELRTKTECRAAGVQDGPVLHALSSAVAGLVAATMGTPADVIKTRVMNQPTDPQTGKGLLYKGSMDCLSRAVKEEGVRPNVRCSEKVVWGRLRAESVGRQVMSLYKGWLPNWMRMAPWSLVFFLTFEQLRVATGQGTF